MVTQYIVNFTDPEKTAFTVNPFTTDGPVAPNTLQLSSTAVRASTSLLLYGKGHPDYGERIAEDFIHLMENFSGATEPQYPISGQTWFARITYAFVGVGSPTTASVYRWEDDSSLTNGGRWITLTNVGASDPTTADEVKTSGTTPATVVDGAFYLDTNGSPLVPELYIGVNNSSSNLSATWLKREVEDLTGLVGPGGQFTSQIGGSPDLKEYLPQKQLKVYDGVQWKNSGNVYSSHVPPQSPAIGDMWYQLGVVGSPPAGSPTLGGGGGPLSQLFIWARPGPGKAPRWLTTGYVDRTGDTMTGPLYFGLPTPSLALWEGQGDDTAGPDFRTTGNGLLASQENFYIHIDYDNSDANAGNVVFEIASNSQTRTAGTFNRLFQVQNDGIIRSALPWGSPGTALGSPNTYKQLLLTTNDDNALINKAYVDDVITTVSSLTTQVNENTANIISLAGSPIPGSPKTPVYNGKVDRIGDTMTGTLFFSFGSPQSGLTGINMGDTLIQNVQTGTAPEDAVNKGYVDGLVTGTLGGDKFVDSGTYDQISGTLTLFKNVGSPISIVSVVPIVTTSDVTHTIDDFETSTNNRFLRDTFQQTKFGSPLFGSPIANFPLSASQAEVNTTALEAVNERLATLELPLAREIIHVGTGSPRTVGGSPVINTTRFSFTNDSFVAGTHRLMVFVNGVKQYVNERGHQRIQFNTSDNVSISSSARTFLNNDSTTYKLQIAVDGGATQELSASGNTLQIFQDIVDEINAQIAGATAVWNFPYVAIDVYSNTTGTNSQINITDGIGSPSVGAGSPSTDYLLSALATVLRLGQGSPLPLSGSPLLTGVSYTLGNIAPTSTAVLQNLAYYEASSGTGSPLIDATFGEVTSNIVFNSQLQPADTIELLYEPVSS